MYVYIYIYIIYPLLRVKFQHRNTTNIEMKKNLVSSFRQLSFARRKSDHSCPGDHVTWEIVLAEGGQCTIECRRSLDGFDMGWFQNFEALSHDEVPW